VKDVLGARVAHDNASIGGVGDNDADRDGIEDCLKASFAAAQVFQCFFVVVDVFEGSVPTSNFSFLVSARRGACPHPAPDSVTATYAVFNIKQITGAKRFFPCSER
jgi:hypothetical protein